MRLNGISGSTFNKAVGRVVVEESDDSDDSHGEETVPDLPKGNCIQFYPVTVAYTFSYRNVPITQLLVVHRRL